MIKNYEILPNGVIKQINVRKKVNYDFDYINNSYNKYGEKGLMLAGVRFGFLLAKIGHAIESILDVGYGNGDFLKVCNLSVTNCYGNDVSNYPIPEGVKFVDNITDKHYDVICFFDVLEHFEDITIVKDLDCDFIYISVPDCHTANDDEWFKNWKHRREDEHLWHFNETSLVNFFNEMGYKLVSLGNIEDVIRVDKNNSPNILTGIFRKI